MAGPSKGIFAVGKAGYLPPFFQKTNKLGVQKNILLVQGLAVTFLSLLFVVMPSVQSFYQILSQLTVILYLIMYMLMFSGAIALRYRMKKAGRPFRIGKSGNGLMWFIGGLGFCGSLLAFVLSFIPPSQISTGNNTVWFAVLIIGAIVVVAAPFIIYAAKKPSWVDPNTAFEPVSYTHLVTMNRECILEQAKQHDSFYLYEEAIIRKNTEQLKTDFPGVTFLYSVKCNPYPEVLRCVLNQGFGVDAASLAECVMGQKAGLGKDMVCLLYTSPDPGQAHPDHG